MFALIRVSYSSGSIDAQFYAVSCRKAVILIVGALLIRFIAEHRQVLL